MGMKGLASVVLWRTKSIACWCLCGFVIMMAGGLTTEAVFKQVHYPGSDSGGVPLTFDLQRKEEILQLLEEQQTLGLFLQVQFLDFGIVIGTLLFFVFLSLWIARALPATEALRRGSAFAALLFLLAPCMDTCENISQIILITFRGQEDLLWLSFLNSCFTLGKMAFFILGWLLLGGMILMIVFRLLRHFLTRTRPDV